jgi:hypothetical protein
VLDAAQYWLGEKTYGRILASKKLAADDNHTRLLHVDAQGCTAVKVEASVKCCGRKSPGVNVPEKSSKK